MAIQYSLLYFLYKYALTTNLVQRHITLYIAQSFNEYKFRRFSSR